MDGRTVGGREDQAEVAPPPRLLCFLVLLMLAEDVQHFGVHGNDKLLVLLRASKHGLGARLLERLAHPYGVVVPVDVGTPKAEQLAEAQPRGHCEGHQRPVRRPDEGQQDQASVVRRDGRALAAPVAGLLDHDRYVPPDPPLLHGPPENLPHGRVELPGGPRRR